MLNDTLVSASLATVGVLLGSMWFGPKFGPVVRVMGLKLVVLAALARVVFKAVS